MIRLDIISDVACPWCYIGKAYLDRALEQHPDHPFTIEWHPFQLDPTIPREGGDRATYLEAKFGSRERVIEVHKPLLDHAARAGVEFDLAAMTRAVNTLDAHRLIHWAGLEGRQTPMVSALFRAYWREGKDIGNRTVLADLAESVGLDRAMIGRLLENDADVAGIQSRIAHSQSRGVQSVPTFIIGNAHALQGAQPPEIWARVIDDLREINT